MDGINSTANFGSMTTTSIGGLVGSSMVGGSNWIAGLNDSVIKNDMTAALTDNAISISEFTKLLDDVKTEIGSGTLTANQFNDFKIISQNTVSYTSQYLDNVFGKFVYGDPNISYQGGLETGNYNHEGTPIGLIGNLGVGDNANKIDLLENRWFKGLDNPDPAWFPAGALIYTAFNSTPLYGNSNAPTIDDCNQGAKLGDCYFVATLGAIALENPNFLKSGIIDNGNGTYGIRYFINGKNYYETVDNQLVTYNSGPPTPVFMDGMTNMTNLWAPLYEKSFAMLNGSYPIYDGGNTTANAYSTIGHAGSVENTITALTGNAVQTVVDYNLSNKQLILDAIANHQIVVCGSNRNPTYDATNGKQDMVFKHAFTVTGYDAATDSLILRNPYGVQSADYIGYAGIYYNTTFEESWTEISTHLGMTTDTQYFIIGSFPTINTYTPSITPNASTSGHYGTTINLNSLVSISDASANITQVSLTVSPSSQIVLNGATNLSSTANTFTVSYSDFSKLLFKFNNLTNADQTDTIQVSAVDDSGGSWSTPVSVSVTDDAYRAPTVAATATQTVAYGSSVKINTLFTAATVETNDSIVGYIITPSANNHSNVLLNGATNTGSAGLITVSAADLAKLTVVNNNSTTSAYADTFGITVIDANGVESSTSASINEAAPTTPPSVAASNTHTNFNGLNVKLSDLITLTPTSGLAITQIKIDENNLTTGSIALNGATNLSNVAKEVLVSLADFAKLTYNPTNTSMTADATDSLVVSAYNGVAWSGTATQNIVNSKDVVPTIDGNTNYSSGIVNGTTIAMSNLVLFSNGLPSVVKVIDETHKGTMNLNGATNLSSTANTYQVSYQDFLKMSYTFKNTSTVPLIHTFDAYCQDSLGNWTNPISTGPAYIVQSVNAPVIHTNTVNTLAYGQSINVSSLFSTTLNDSNDHLYNVRITDPNGNIQLHGATNNDSNGSVMVNVTNGDFAKLTINNTNTTTSAQSETLTIQVYDTYSNSSQPVNMTVNFAGVKAPVVNGSNQTVGVNGNVSLSSLFGVSLDNGNDSIRNISISDPGSLGSVTGSGTSLSGYTYKWNNPSTSAQTETLTATITDIYGNTGTATANITNAAVKAPNVSGNGQTVDVAGSMSLSSLFSVSLNDGSDKITNISISDPGGLGSVTGSGTSLSGYTYHWNNRSTSANAETLTATITDSFGITGTATATITNAAVHTPSIGTNNGSVDKNGSVSLSSLFNVNLNNNADSISSLSVSNSGSGSVSGSGNSLDGYHFNWGNGSADPSNGTVNVTITDVYGVSASASVTVSNAGDPSKYVAPPPPPAPVDPDKLLAQSLTGKTLQNTDVGSLSAGVIQYMGAGQFNSMTPDQLGGLNVGALTSQQVSGLSGKALNAINLGNLGDNFQYVNVGSLNSDQISAMPVGQMSSVQVAAISGKMIPFMNVGSLPQEKLAALSGGAISNMTTDQVNGVVQNLTPKQAAAITVKQIAATGGQVNFNSDQLAMLGNGQIQALDVNSLGDRIQGIKVNSLSTQQIVVAASMLSTTQIGQLSGNAAKVLTSDNINALSNDQVGAIGSTIVKNLTTTALNVLIAQKLPSLSSSAIAAIPTQSIAALTADVIAGIPTSVIPLLPANDLKVLTTVQVMSMSADQIGALTTLQIPQLQPQMLNVLNAGQFGGFNSDQIKMLKANQIQALLPSAIAAMAGGVFNSLSATQVKAFSTTQLATVDPSLITGMSTGIIGALSVAQITNMTSDQISAMNADQIGSLGSSVLKGFNEKLGKVGTAFIQALTSDQIKILNSAEIASLKTDQLAVISADQEAAITASQVKSFVSGQVKALGAGFIANMTTTQFNALAGMATSLTSDQISGITATELSAITAPFLTSLTTSQLSLLSGDQVGSISAKGIKALNNAQISAVNPSAFTTSQIAALTANQASGLSTSFLQNLSGDALAAFSAADIKALSGAQVSVMQVGAFTSTQIKALTAPVLGGLSTDALAALGPQGFASLAPSALAGLTAAQTKSLSGDVLNSLGKAINNLPVAALGIDQVSSLSQEEIALITSGSLSSIVAAAFKADGFVGNLSGKQLNSILSSQFQQVNLGAIGGDAEKILSGSQLANATSSQLMAVANSDFANNLSKSQRNNLSKSQLGILFSGS